MVSEWRMKRGFEKMEDSRKWRVREISSIPEMESSRILF
jgi:hypothetical protein